MNRQTEDRPKVVLRRAQHVEGTWKPMRCERCAGLVVAEQFIGGATSNGGWAYSGWRCVNCGAIDVFGQAGGRPVLRPFPGAGGNGGLRRVPSTKSRRHE
jgi:hypothetical protein